MLHLWKKNTKKVIKKSDHSHYTGKYRGAAHSICNLKFSVPNEIPAVFHNGSNYFFFYFGSNYFSNGSNIIKELANKFEGKFKCLGENKEKYKTFSVKYIKIFIIKMACYF